MIAAFAFIFIGLLASALVVYLGAGYVFALRRAQHFAEEYVEAVGKIVEDGNYPNVLVLFLLDVGKILDHPRELRRVARHFISKSKLSSAPGGKTSELMSAFDMMSLSQKVAVGEAMVLFLASASYRDFFRGRRVRAALLEPNREKRMVVESLDLAGALSASGGLAYV